MISAAFLACSVLACLVIGCGELDSTTRQNSPGVETALDPKVVEAKGSETDGEGKKQPTKLDSNDPMNQVVMDVGFEGLTFNLQPDVVFRPGFMPAAITELNGKKIRVQGYMHAGVQKREGLTSFILLQNTECKFGPGGQADHLIKVKLAGNLKTNYSTKLITIEGVLTIAPFKGIDGNTWSLYDMECDMVKASQW